MTKRVFISTLVFLFVGSVAFSAPQQTPVKDIPQPLTRSTLLALVSGAALPENTVSEIQRTGLAFQPDNAYRALLKTAGADPSIFSALNSAKVTGSEPRQQTEDSQRLKQLADAGQLLKQKRYKEATDELTAELKSSFKNATGEFVMGEILTEQSNWPEAAAAYAAVLQENPRFPEAHTKASFVLYKLEDGEDALNEANFALALTPDNPEAHKNAGLALDQLGKFDASLVQYKEALRLKPDYQNVHMDLGNLLTEKKDFDGAIAEYRKAVYLNPNDALTHYNLGYMLDEKSDIDGAIREYREAKRLDPTRFDVRQNLSHDLMSKGLYPEAVVELRGMEAIFPTSDVCHRCTGNALFDAGQYQDAKTEYRTALRLDPSDPDNHIALADLLEYQKDLDGALSEYLSAQRLGTNSDFAYAAAGRIYLAKKDYENATRNLKQAEMLAPDDSLAHDLYGQVLQATGQIAQANAEFRESLLLNPKQPAVRLRYAATLEKSGDFSGALDQYRQAAQADPADSTQQAYKSAQHRLAEQLKTLKAEGKASEASQLKSSIRATQQAPGISDKLDSAIASGNKEMMVDHNLDDALRDFQSALELAQKLQPHDGRLPDVLSKLGLIYLHRSEFAKADDAFRQELAAIQEVHGPRSPDIADPLYWMGMCSVAQKDFPTGEKLFLQAIQETENVYGENSSKNILYMTGLANLYRGEGQDAKAISYFERTIKIGEKFPGSPQYQVMANLYSLAGVYDSTGKLDQAESCLERLFTDMQNQYGANSPQLLVILDKEESLLHRLGRTADAANVEKQMASIKAASASSNPN
ncbi:MAG TPA: tetratricopeptide repeat protein [Candidatus Angelobacter sp.]|nr:tetratricopeptide repeat protein [Candidatus Angelobacter sp.]